MYVTRDVPGSFQWIFGYEHIRMGDRCMELRVYRCNICHTTQNGWKMPVVVYLETLDNNQAYAHLKLHKNCISIVSSCDLQYSNYETKGTTENFTHLIATDIIPTTAMGQRICHIDEVIDSIIMSNAHPEALHQSASVLISLTLESRSIPR